MAIFLILALNVLVFIGINAARIIFSLYGLNLGASPAGVGGVMAMLYVFPLLLSWPIGVLSDRFQARWLLAGGTAVGACGMLVPYLFPVLASLYVFPLLLSWPIGVLSDRFQARWLLAGGTAVGACGMLVPYLFPVLASLYVSATLLGLTLALTAVMGQSLIGSLSKPEERTRNFSNYAMTGSLS